MKTQLTSLALALLVSFPGLAPAQTDLERDPAYLPIDKVLDLKLAKPEVSVNLPRFLLMDAVSEVDLGTNSPFAAAGTSLKELVQDIKLIRFIILSTDDTNKSHVDEAVAKLNKHLETNWVSVFSLPEENIGVFVLSDPSGEAVGGVAMIMHNGNETILGNIVGRVSIGKLLKVATKIDRKNGASFIPKDLIERLTQASTGGGSSEKSSKPAN
jgi:hypothetical protein